MKTQRFNGMLHKDRVKRTFTTIDPGTGRAITSTHVFTQIDGLVLEKVSGHGKANRTGEPYITLNGQYDQFSPVRITAGSDRALALKEKIRPLLDETAAATHGQEIPLKEEITVTAIVKAMSAGSFGYTVEELYRVDPKTGETTDVLIGPRQEMTKDVNVAAEQAFL
jgi:hypothetical protein